MTATAFTEAMHPMAPLVSKQHLLSIDEVIVAQNQTIVVGQVLGSVGVAGEETSTVTPGVGNTGNGALTVAAVNPSAVDGTYNVVMLSAGGTAEFEVGDPTGVIVGTGKVGTAFVGPLTFTIAAGGTAFAVGDTFNIQVLRPFDEQGEQFEAWNPAATDGSQIARAVAMYPAITGAGVTAKIAAVRRNAEVRAADLTWNGSATAGQIAEATQQLAKANIILR